MLLLIPGSEKGLNALQGRSPSLDYSWTGWSPQADTSFLFVILAYPSPIYNEKYSMKKCLLLILQI